MGERLAYRAVQHLVDIEDNGVCGRPIDCGATARAGE
jgi:hypothetical protein